MAAVQRRESVLERAQREAPGNGLPIHVTPPQHVVFRRLVLNLLAVLAGGLLLAAGIGQVGLGSLICGGLIAVVYTVRSIGIARQLHRPRWILRIDAQGIQARSPLPNVSVPWAEMADIVVSDLKPRTVVVTLGRPTAGQSAQASWFIQRKVKLRAHLLGCSSHELRACLLANRHARVFAG